MPDLKNLRTRLRQGIYRNETELMRELIAGLGLSPSDRDAISAQGAEMVRRVRATGQVGVMERFLAEYGLSTDEGVALMCLAEAMLRVPDAETVDALIHDKITPHDWASHIGDSGSILVNASTWALMLTGRVLDDAGQGIAGTLHALVRRMGEPVIRKAVGQAMAEMGNQFVLGQSIETAMTRGQAMVDRGYTYSYDMLGEAARTHEDAEQYFHAYCDAISAIAGHAVQPDIRANPGISVKLSALHPRYEMAQRDTMLPAMTDRLLQLCHAAKDAGIGLNIDAEEADRLDLSLDVIAATLAAPSLAGWHGFGVVVQAYGRRAMPVLDWLHALAESLDRRIMVRLVKGAYWDTEIKQAQVQGLPDYPVFTRKAHTDTSYLAGARKLLAMSDRIYPQFATHNAHTIAAVLKMAGDRRDHFEFQRLHGMGEALHDDVRAMTDARCRIYAPVGTHKDLLAYLVRRLLENGANSSFVNQIVDLQVAPEDIAQDPVSLALGSNLAANPGIPAPSAIFAPRTNSHGWDLSDPVTLAQINEGRVPFEPPYRWQAHPITPVAPDHGTPVPVMNPARLTETAGQVQPAPPRIIDAALRAGEAAHPDWAARGAAHRAAILRRAAEIYEGHSFEILALLAREAGKTLPDGVAEIREAVDFLRYYADQAEQIGQSRAPRGVIACISPWNFPLAIFTGQIAAALAAGNAVIAKPAEQTPLIAQRAVQWMLAAGVPPSNLQLLPGDGETIGAPLVAHPRIAGVCFTGSTDVAKRIDRQLAQTAPQAALIAETGGLNAMIVDSTALLEQATRDILRSAFQSAGQRCSALRIVYAQSDIAEPLIRMITGAMQTLQLGDPWHLATDAGPLIDAAALHGIQSYLDTAQVIAQGPVPEGGYYLPPTLVRVQGIEDLDREIFGPVLHIAPFDGPIGPVIDAINARGFGLTFGCHSRIDARVQEVVDQVSAGNIYVNRDQIGAVVGAQPFGGHGLSGTGPKAGGPHYLSRFYAPAPAAAPGPIGAAGSQAPLPDAPVSTSELQAACINLRDKSRGGAPDRITALRRALRGRAAPSLTEVAKLDFEPIDLPGPTGESNQLLLEPRGLVLCTGSDPATLLHQVARALGTGNRVLAVAPQARQSLRPLRQIELPLTAIDGHLAPDGLSDLPTDAVAWAGDAAGFARFRRALSLRDGPILPLIGPADPAIMFCVEKSVCIDTTAAGGNASLLAETEQSCAGQ